MNKFLNDIRNQPEHIRELYAGLCTAVVVAVVIAIWFHSFKHNVYALLNPSEEAQTQNQFFAAGTPSSLFGYIGQAVVAGRAEISSLFSGSGSDNQANAASHGSGQIHFLPVSGDR